MEAPYGNMWARTCGIKKGRNNFSTTVAEIVELLSDRECFIFLVPNPTTGNFDNVYCLIPADLPDLKSWIEQ